MADAPSPYAPGIIADERLPPRAAGRAVPFLVGTFVTTILVSGFWQLWLRSGTPTAARGDLVLVAILRNVSALPILLWAYLSDRIPVWGTRREGYLALATMTMGAAWLAVTAVHEPLAWSAVAAPFGLATVFARAAILGALAEIGRRRAATGRLAGAHVGLAQLAELALQRAMLPMTFMSAWLPAGIAAGLALAVVLLLVALASDDAPTPQAPAPEAALGIPRFLRSRAFWGSTAVLACAGLAAVPQALVWQQLRAAHGDAFEAWSGSWTTPAIMSVAALAYLAICRRLAFVTLLRAALLVKVGALTIHALTAGSTAAATLDLVLNVRAAGDGLAAAALLDLVLRVAPRGREAFGAILLAGIPNVIMTVVAALVVPFAGISVSKTAWFATGAAIAAVLAVSLLPRSIVAAREGQAEGRVVGSAP